MDERDVYMADLFERQGTSSRGSRRIPERSCGVPGCREVPGAAAATSSRTSLRLGRESPW